MNAKVKYSTIIVKDMEESIRFYKDIMGFEIDSQYTPTSDVTITLMKTKGDAMIELIKDSMHDVGFYSVGMDVEDLNAAIKELKSKGTKIIMGPVDITVGSLAFLEDPNGVRIALIEHN